MNVYGLVILRPSRWVSQPVGYQMLGMNGTIGGGSFAGTVGAVDLEDSSGELDICGIFVFNDSSFVIPDYE